MSFQSFPLSVLQCIKPQNLRPPDTHAPVVITVNHNLCKKIPISVRKSFENKDNEVDIEQEKKRVSIET